MAEYVSAHLAWTGVDLEEVEWQTDNGVEVLEDRHQRGLPPTFRLLRSDHHDILIKTDTWRSGVETVLRLVEDEFFVQKSVRLKADFWKWISWYWYDFKISRPNRHKNKKAPLHIINERNPKIHSLVASKVNDTGGGYGIGCRWLKAIRPQDVAIGKFSVQRGGSPEGDRNAGPR